MAVRDKLILEIQADVAQLKRGLAESKSEVKGFGSNLKKIGGLVAGAFAIDQITSFGRAVFDTTAEFQKFEAVLTNTLGSGSAARNALSNIEEFASKTPFSVAQLTDSFVKLANQGFRPTTNEMRKLGDLASSTGKDFDQLAEAIIDAQTGEFERLKEFGIRASKQGDQVKFTFKEVETQVDFTSDSIRDYVLSLGDAEGVSGAMNAISKTLGGQVSNLGDSFDTLKRALGSEFQGAMSTTLSGLTSLTDAIAERVQDGTFTKLFKIIFAGGNQIGTAAASIEQAARKAAIALQKEKDELAAIELEKERIRKEALAKLKKNQAAMSSAAEMGEEADAAFDADLFMPDAELQKVLDKKESFQESLRKSEQEHNKLLSEQRKMDDAEMQAFIQEQNQRIAEQDQLMLEERMATLSQVGEFVTAFTGTIQQGLTQMSDGLIDSLGLADKGIAGFVKSMLKALAQVAIAQLTGLIQQKIMSKVDLGIKKKQAQGGAVATATNTAASMGPAGLIALPGLIAGALALVTGTFAGIQAFAKGGVVTSPMMGLVGEAGPEAIIPLNRLDSMMGGGNREFTIRGQDLVLAMDRANGFKSRITG